MGAVGLNSPKLGAFQSDIFPRGLDLGRSVIEQDLGFWRADDVADFEAGMLVGQNGDGNIIKCVGAPVLGVAKWNKTNTLKAVSSDEPLVFPTSAAVVNLKHATVTNFQLRSATDLGGSAFTGSGTDFTLNATNGTVTHPGSGAIGVGVTVFATYTFELTSSDLEFQGRNFFNFTDDVSIADGRITVINDASLLFTSQFDSSRTFTLGGVGGNLFCGGGSTAELAGLFTNDSGEGDFVGSVIQLPSADDPFLGVRITGDPVEQ